MALTYIETVRLLMGDLDAGDNNFFTADQWAHFFGTLSYDDEDGNSKVNFVEVAIDALRTLSIYHADSRPERSKKLDDRVDALSRWPDDRKARNVFDGLPDGIGMADAFRGPPGGTGPPGPPGPRGSAAVPVLQAQLWVTNAQLKTLDTDYRQVVAAPGAGKFIQVRQLWIQKHGSDQPPEHTEYYRVAISPNPVITEAEALAGSGRGDTFGEIPVQDWNTPHYFYAGTSLTNQDVTSLDGLTDFAATFERVPGSIVVDGLAFKWWRTRQTYASRAELFLHGRATTRVRRDTSAPTTERIGRNMRFALLFEDDSPAGPYPLANEDQTIVSGYTYDSLLAAPASAVFAYAIGGQVLFEHQALMLGGAFDLLEQWRSAYFSTATHDTYLGTVNDVAFGITVRYEIHDATTPPPGP